MYQLINKPRTAGIPIILFIAAAFCPHPAFAGTVVTLSGDVHLPIGVDPDDLNLKTKDGKVFATIQDYTATLTILKGATIEIHKPGGFLDNLAWSKGQARVNESFSIGESAIVREVAYSDGVPRVTTCTVNGKPSDGMLKLSDSISIDLKDPKLALWLKPYSGRQYYLTIAAIAALLCALIAWFVVRRHKQQRGGAAIPV
jgi:hypothetical protein